MSLKILISGYFGKGNFGDEAILHTMVQNFKEITEPPNIIAISANPDKTSKDFGINCVKKEDFFGIIKAINNANIYVVSGGSIFQDVTSLKSIIYYAFWLNMARLLGKKTCIYAQGIGPINTKLGKIFTYPLLKKVNLIMVRDAQSQQLLKKNGINSHLTADNVWDFQIIRHPEQSQIGINLREWKGLTTEKKSIIADAIAENFKDQKIILLSGQDSQDLVTMEKFGLMLERKGIDFEIKKDLTINDIIQLFSSFKMFIGMRFHACLIALKYAIPTVALSYDIKVDKLAKDAGIPCIKVDEIDAINVDNAIKNMINEKEEYAEKTKNYSEKNVALAKENLKLFKEKFVGYKISS